MSFVAQADLLAGTRATFAEAWQAAGPDNAHEATFLFAGHPVRMQVAGSELATIFRRCFEPLMCPEEATGAAALSIHAWDRSATGVGCPGIPYAPDKTDVLGPGLLSQYRDGAVLRYDRSTIVKNFDRQRCDLFICAQDARALGLNDRTKPFPHFLATWYLDRGVQLLHAGAVSRNGKGYPFRGRGRRGQVDLRHCLHGRRVRFPRRRHGRRRDRRRRPGGACVLQHRALRLAEPELVPAVQGD